MDNFTEFISNNLYFLSVVSDKSDATASNWSSMFQMIGQFFFLMLAFIIIVFLAIYSLRLASRLRGFNGGSSNIRLLETKPLGTGNFVHLVKIGKKYILIGSSKENVTFLSDVDRDAIIDSFDELSKMPKEPFETLLTKKLKGLGNKNEPPGE